METVDPKNTTPEQVEALKEKLKNMSPEEMVEFQKKQCIFCQIINGKVQAKKIYEDETTLALLDINPANPGHLLLLPKEHYTVMPQVPDDNLTHIFTVAKFLSNTMLRALDAKGTNIIVANGPAAGQRAQHFMVHIIPRKENDKIEFVLPQKQIPEKELDSIKGKLLEKISFKEAKPKEEKKFDVAEILKQKTADTAVTGESKEEKEKKPKKTLKKREKQSKKPEKEGVNLDDISRMFDLK